MSKAAAKRIEDKKRAISLIAATERRKALFLKLYEKHRCNVTAVCRAMHMSRRTYWDWCQLDPDFKSAVADAFESTLDHVEAELHKMIDRGNEPAALIFFLKTRGKARGYVEKSQFEQLGPDGKPAVPVVMIMPRPK